MRKCIKPLFAALLALTTPASAQLEACLPAFCGAPRSTSCSDFTIPSATSLVTWIDACVTSSFSLSGAAILSVVDQSTNSYTFVSGPVPPIYNTVGWNGRPTITFQDTTTLQDLNNHTVALGTGNELTVFAVATLSDDAVNGFHGNGRLMSYTGPGAAHDYDNNASFTINRVGNTSAQAYTRNSITTSQAYGYNTQHRLIFTLKSDGTRTFYIDGVATTIAAGAVANFSSPGYLSVGGSQFDSGFFNGYYAGLISEIGAYNVFYDATQVAALDTYMKNKWGM